MNQIAAILGLLLVVSVAGNALLFDAIGEARARVARVEEARASAIDAAQACGASVRQLQEVVQRQQIEAKAVIDAAQKFAGQQRKVAEAERRRAQAVPGNACASAEVETREWLQRRRAAQ